MNEKQWIQKDTLILHFTGSSVCGHHTSKMSPKGARGGPRFENPKIASIVASIESADGSEFLNGTWSVSNCLTRSYPNTRQEKNSYILHQNDDTEEKGTHTHTYIWQWISMHVCSLLSTATNQEERGLIRLRIQYRYIVPEMYQMSGSNQSISTFQAHTKNPEQYSMIFFSPSLFLVSDQRKNHPS